MSIQKVARAAGVSVATVSRTFNFPDRVTAGTREVVQAAARAVGYIPDLTARTLRTRRSRVIGVVLPTLLNPVFAECLQGIAAAASEEAYSISPMTTDYRVEREAAAATELIARRVDAAILVVSSPETSESLVQLRQASVPYVLAYNWSPAHPCVSVDNEAAVRELVARLVSLGHRRIAMVGGQRSASDRAQQRWRGFQAGMRACGLAPPALIEVPFMETAAARIGAALRQRDRPTALVCSNDLLALRAMRAARLAGLEVPRDLSVAGFDGIAIGEDFAPILSTITQPSDQIGRRSVSMLTGWLDRAEPLDAAASVCLAHGFRAGESSAAAPAQA